MDGNEAWRMFRRSGSVATGIDRSRIFVRFLVGFLGILDSLGARSPGIITIEEVQLRRGRVVLRRSGKGCGSRRL